MLIIVSIVWNILETTVKPDLPCPDILGLSIYRASMLSPENKLYVWIVPKFTVPLDLPGLIPFPQEAQ